MLTFIHVSNLSTFSAIKVVNIFSSLSTFFQQTVNIFNNLSTLSASYQHFQQFVNIFCSKLSTFSTTCQHFQQLVNIFSKLSTFSAICQHYFSNLSTFFQQFVNIISAICQHFFSTSSGDTEMLPGVTGGMGGHSAWLQVVNTFNQSWALLVFLIFFNNKIWFFAFFIKLIWFGVGFVNRTGAAIGY